MEKIKVFLVEDHSIVRAGLRLLIENQIDIEVVGEAEDCDTALLMLSEKKVDIVLLDLMLRNDNSIKSIEKIILDIDCHILVLTMLEDVFYLRAALAAGALGYLSKRSSSDALIDAIRAVFEGSLFIDPSLGFNLFNDVLKDGDGLAKEPIPLSGREQEVLEFLVHGLTNRQIAERILISVKTVETYRARLGKKLGLKQRADFIRYGLLNGMLKIKES